MTLRQEAAALRDFDPAYVRRGFKLCRLEISAARLLYPLKPDIGWRGWHVYGWCFEGAKTRHDLLQRLEAPARPPYSGSPGGGTWNADVPSRSIAFCTRPDDLASSTNSFM